MIDSMPQSVAFRHSLGNYNNRCRPLADDEMKGDFIMADIRRYEGITNPAEQREIIGTLKEVTVDRKDKEGNPTGKTQTGYVATLQLNANDERTKIASEANPSGGANLNLDTNKYKGKDGKDKFGHSRFYTEEQGKKMMEAAGKNVAPQLNSDGKKVDGVQVVAFKADLVVSKDGLAVNTAKPMGPSEIATFGKSGKKAYEAMSAQYAAMKDCKAKAAAKDAPGVDKNIEAPEVSNDMEADGPQMG